MNKYFFIFIVFFLSSFISSCKERETEEIVGDRVDSFATHYFNWQFEKCLPYITANSEKYIRLAASNVTEGNVEKLRSAESDATIDIDDVNMLDENNAEVSITINNYLHADTIGREAKFHESGTAVINMVKEGGKWKVVMPNGLIRTAYRQQNELTNLVLGLD